jgi:hypothetical protein
MTARTAFTDSRKGFVHILSSIRVSVPWIDSDETVYDIDVERAFQELQALGCIVDTSDKEAGNLPEWYKKIRETERFRLAGEGESTRPLSLTSKGRDEIRRLLTGHIFTIDERFNPKYYCPCRYAISACSYYTTDELLGKLRGVVEPLPTESQVDDPYEGKNHLKPSAYNGAGLLHGARPRRMSSNDLQKWFRYERERRRKDRDNGRSLSWQTFNCYADFEHLKKMHAKCSSSGLTSHDGQDIELRAPIWRMIRRQLVASAATVYPMMEDGSYTSSMERVSLYGNTVIYLGGGETDDEANQLGILLAHYLAMAKLPNGESRIWKVYNGQDVSGPMIYVLKTGVPDDHNEKLRLFRKKHTTYVQDHAVSSPADFKTVHGSIVILTKGIVAAVNIEEARQFYVVAPPCDYAKTFGQLCPGRVWRRGTQTGDDESLRMLRVFRCETKQPVGHGVYPGPLAIAYTHAIGQLDREMLKLANECSVAQSLTLAYKMSGRSYMLPEVGTISPDAGISYAY